MRVRAGGSAGNAAAYRSRYDRRNDKRDDHADDQQRNTLHQGIRGQSAQKACLHTLTVRGASKARCKY